ncbi:single-stranded DNA-binding protein [Novosphingobium aquae]|uniref:Single-stranded DNA-binding protein n=1 Tax=Novosphingobium aquae TaxID=3133435 RepID=A0ABU8SBV0_9SPHN
MYLNKAMIYGNLTRDPELKALPNGQQVCSLSLATNRSYNDRDGKRQEETEYHNVVVFGKTAENCAKYLTKASPAYVEGRIQTRSWDKDGVKQYRTEIVADIVQFGPKSGATTVVRDEDAHLPTDEITEEEIPF